jgi:hypothetical protein
MLLSSEKFSATRYIKCCWEIQVSIALYTTDCEKTVRTTHKTRPTDWVRTSKSLFCPCHCFKGFSDRVSYTETSWRDCAAPHAALQNLLCKKSSFNRFGDIATGIYDISDVYLRIYTIKHFFRNIPRNQRYNTRLLISPYYLDMRSSWPLSNCPDAEQACWGYMLRYQVPTNAKFRKS